MAPAALASSHAFAFEDDDLPPCPQEASFSSYLSAADGGLSLRLSGEFTHNSLTPVMRSLGNSMKKEAGADGELDVFSAEKYFSGGMDGDEQLETKLEKPWKSSSPVKEVAFRGGKTSWSGTPNASSETSRHSRGSLLKDPKRDLSQDPHKPPQPAGGKKFLGLFRCSCVDNSCEETDDQKPGSWPETGCNEETRWRRTDKAGGPLSPKREDYSNISPALYPVVLCNSTVGEEVFEEERKGRRTPSMDSFGTPPLGKEALAASSLRRSLTMSATFTGGAARDSDVCSESSSDLFEIEHLAVAMHPFGMGGASALRCYEPSEASIEWSVVTASAANFSVGSDIERSPTEVRKAKETQQHQRPGGMLLGCGGDKAVRISSNIYKFPENMETAERRQRNRSMDAALPMIRYQAERPNLVDFDRQRAGHLSVARGVVPAHHHCPQ